MLRRSDGLVLRQFRTLFNLGVIGELTDGQLLERFATAGGEAAELAFAALVERHGPMVLRICRNALRDRNDVEDAFQAAFLVLVRQARSLWVEDSLAPWIHRVARRIAMRARANAARRKQCERRAAEIRSTTTANPVDDTGLMDLLYEEIDRLPERCRVPVVLCDLEGLTHEQAARYLSWPIGTVKSRLMSGRERLRARLVRRGVAPAVALVKAATPAGPASAAVPAGLVEITVRAACRVAAGAGASTAGAVPAAVALLMEGAQSAMFMTRIKFVLLACGLIAGGAVVAAQQAGRNHREATTHRPADAGATGSVAVSPAGSEDDGTAVAQEMAGLELGLLEDEVRQLRVQVNTALQSRIHYETRSSRGENIGHELIEAARQAHQLAREAYLEKARELARSRRRLGKKDEPRATGREESAEAAVSDKDHIPGGEDVASGARGPAAVGSIDMDAVFKRYEKVRHAKKALDTLLGDTKDRNAAIVDEAKAITERMQKLPRDSVDYQHLAAKFERLKQRSESERAKVEKDIPRRHARQMAALLGEIQEAVASVARARGLDTIVRVSPGPQPDAEPNDIHAALNRSVLYANPRNDITDEVIRELNQRFEAGGEKSRH